MFNNPKSFDLISIDTNTWLSAILKNSRVALGDSSVDQEIEMLVSDGISDNAQEICELLSKKYKQAFYTSFFNTCNYSNDLDEYVLLTFFITYDSGSFIGCSHSLVGVEVSQRGGDPRGCYYRTLGLFKPGYDAKCALCDTYIKWDVFLKSDNNEWNFTNSVENSYQLSKEVYSTPVWSDKHGSFVARFRDHKRICLLNPCTSADYAL